MFRIKCKCGKSEKSFKFNIGPFYVDECCEAAEKEEKPIVCEECNCDATIAESCECNQEIKDEVVEIIEEKPKAKKAKRAKKAKKEKK